MTVLAIDIGGSGSRLVAADGAAVRAEGPPPALGTNGHQHADVIRELARGVGPLHASIDTVAVSATGIISRGFRHDVISAITECWAPRHVIVAADAVAAVVAAWGLSGGAVVAAGTGVIGFGTDLRDEWRRSDGWGHELGDEGGAAWIGRHGLMAALRARDGRKGGSDALLHVAQERFGDIADLPLRIREAASAAHELARFAPDVTAASRSGDEAAGEIVHRAAGFLAEAGLSVLDSAVPSRLALIGGLSSDEQLSSMFLEEVRTRRPDLQVVIAGTSPIDGALELARESAAGLVRPSHPPHLTFHDQGES